MKTLIILTLLSSITFAKSWDEEIDDAVNSVLSFIGGKESKIAVDDDNDPMVKKLKEGKPLEVRVEETQSSINIVITHSSLNTVPEIKIDEKKIHISSQSIEERKTNSEGEETHSRSEYIAREIIDMPKKANWKAYKKTSTDTETTIAFELL